MTESVAGCRVRALKAVADLPPFSPILDRLLATLSSEGVSVANISDLIERDAVIAGNVLKLVNSALYGRQGTVNSVRHAVSLLGINKVRNAVFAMSITRMWSKMRAAAGFSMAKFNLQAVAGGLLCDYLAPRAPVEYAEGAFAAGLFRNLGELLIAVALHQEYGEIQRLSAGGFGLLVECETEVIGVSHAELSAEALAVWNLPAAIRRAVRFHHAPDADTTDMAPGQYRLAQVLECADRFLELAGESLGSEEPPAPAALDAFRMLGLAPQAAVFIKDYKRDVGALTGVFR